jgi:hypothetical protein
VIHAALVMLSTTTFISTSRDIYESYLLVRSIVIFTLDEFYGEKYFEDFQFRCFLRKKQHGDRLVNDLCIKFENAVLVFEDATIGNNNSLTPCPETRDLL